MNNKIIAFIVSTATFLMSLLLPYNTVTAAKDETDFVPVLRFAAISDTHVLVAGDERTGRIQKVLTLALKV